MTKRTLANVIIGIFPSIVSAQSSLVYSGSSGISGIFSWFGALLSTVLPLIIALAIVWFVYNVFRFTIQSSSDEDRAKAKTDIVWGIVGIFVMVYVWGLVNVLRSTFNLSNTMIQAPIINIKK